MSNLNHSGFFEMVSLSSLSKVFPDEELTALPWDKGSMFRNEVYSFQVAYRWKGNTSGTTSVECVSKLKLFITMRVVGLVSSEFPCYPITDENVLRTSTGLYPDVLVPLTDGQVTFDPKEWHSIWITVDGSMPINPGDYCIKIVLGDPVGDEVWNCEFNLTVIDAILPKQSMIHTEWFHSDCLATFYKVDVFSEEHWNLIERYIKTAVQHGINMILTPVFTLPLDTAIGGERPTAQLVDVTKIDSAYVFNFDKLKRWITICLRNEVKYLEISHLFTQWGAEHAPKIIATENGVETKIFGWDTDAHGVEYTSFLSQFLPALIIFLKDNHLEKLCYFHVSDEPAMDCLESYREASAIMNKYLKDFPVMDALSNYEFYEKGLVKNPIPATDHIEKFIENKVPNLWTYYCCGQSMEVSNRFINMPSARNRIIGLQLYKFGIYGFLHWGYNFWYSRNSDHPIDPFCLTDIELGYPSGDAFLVYPGEDGPIESLRLEVFYEALQDMRALTLLESLIGKKAVIDILEEGLEEPITFKKYPSSEEWLLKKREEINECIVKKTRK